MGSAYDFQIPVQFQHRIRFGRSFFDRANPSLIDLLEVGFATRRVLAFVDEGLLELVPDLEQQVANYFTDREDFEFCGLVALPGGEQAKADDQVLTQAWNAIDQANIDRHSYVFAIGGGAFLDVIGFAAATAHRGVRLVRFPTTTLSQDDSGVGVKNGINSFSKKNWIGSFAVPFAVINDFDYLHLQPEKQRRDGLVEAVKVAAVKDAEFFNWIEANVESLAALDEPVLEEAVERSAILHAKHIAQGGDPFETGSSRPLDFGHWAAHKLEQLTNFELSHAEAVGIGLALDVLYSVLSGRLPKEQGERILRVLEGLKVDTWHPQLAMEDPQSGLPIILDGLEEFREHLGGRLTVLFLNDIGSPMDLHEVNHATVIQALTAMKLRQPCD